MEQRPDAQPSAPQTADRTPARGVTPPSPSGDVHTLGPTVECAPDGAVRIRAPASGEARRLVDEVALEAAEAEIRLDPSDRRRLVALARTLAAGLPALDTDGGAVRLYGCGRLALRLPDGTRAEAPASAVFERARDGTLELLWSAQLTDANGRRISCVTDGQFDAAELVACLEASDDLVLHQAAEALRRARTRWTATPSRLAAWLGRAGEHLAQAAALLALGAGLGAVTGTAPEVAFAGAAAALLVGAALRRS